jgi:hypothetical protein
MSYLDFPRVCFLGKFQADVSTINNDPGHYTPEVVRNPWWNPGGSNRFQFQGGTVTSVTLPGGDCKTTQAGDRIVTAPVISTNDPQMGKLVDLDSEQQMVSQVWGLQLCIGDQTSGNYVLGNFRAVNFRDITFGRAPQPADGIGGASATYLSVIDVLEWGTSLSPAMSKLQTLGGDLLSIRFVVDLYDDIQNLPTPPNSTIVAPNPNFTWGRVSGAIGPANPSDPRNFVVGRFLRIPPAPPQSGAANAAAVANLGAIKSGALMTAPPPAAQLPAATYNYAPAIVDGPNDRITFDFGNSLCVTQSGDAYPGMGTLQATIAGSRISLPIPATTDDYTQRSWIYDFHGNGIAAAAATSPLSLLENGSPVLVENPNGTYVDFTEWVYRANPEDESFDVTVMTLQWGSGVSGTVSLEDASGNGPLQTNGLMLPNAQPPDPASYSPTNMPFSTTPGGVTYPPSVITNSDGTYTFQVAVEDPLNPRDGLEGQVYRIAPIWDQDSNPDPWIAANILLHSTYPIPDTPVWETDVLPIFAQYMKLYPFMKARMDLTDEKTVKSNASVIENMLTLPMTDPRFMPVTRDLSSSRLATILKWLQQNGASTPPSPLAH